MAQSNSSNSTEERTKDTAANEQLLQAIADVAVLVGEIKAKAHDIGEADLASKLACAEAACLYQLKEFE
ncbi:MAG: hypothetical protein AAGI88_15475 [Pseudomonadota bacterium]